MTADLATRRTAGMDVDTDLVLEDEFVDDAPGHGTGFSAWWCA